MNTRPILTAVAAVLLIFGASGRVRAGDGVSPPPASLEMSNSGLELEGSIDDFPCDQFVPRPTWTFRGGIVALRRQSDPSTPLAGGIIAILDAADLSYPLRGGPDLDLTRHGQIADVEFRYFGVDQFSASAGPVPAAATFGFVTVPGSAFFIGSPNS